MDDIYTDLQFLTTMLTAWDGITLDGEKTNRQEIIKSIGSDYMNFALSILRLQSGFDDFDTEKVCRMFRVDASASEMNEYASDVYEMSLMHLTVCSQTLRTAILFDAEFSRDKNVPVMSKLVIDLYERIYDELVGIYEEEDPAYKIYRNFIEQNQLFFDLFALPEVKKKMEDSK